MSFATSRVFRGCRALLAAAKSSSTASAAAKPAKSKATPKPKPKPKPKPATPSRPVGIMKASPVSPALRDFLGAPEASRADAVKKIWAHIKDCNLQNPANKREINCDAKLKVLFDGRDSVNFLEIGKLLSRHFVKTT